MLARLLEVDPRPGRGSPDGRGREVGSDESLRPDRAVDGGIPPRVPGQGVGGGDRLRLGLGWRERERQPERRLRHDGVAVAVAGDVGVVALGDRVRQAVEPLEAVADRVADERSTSG